MDIKSYRVIYDLVDDVRALMEGKLAPTEERLPIGEAEVRAVFGSGSRIVAGVMVTEGHIRKGCHAAVRAHILLLHAFLVIEVPQLQSAAGGNGYRLAQQKVSL